MYTPREIRTLFAMAALCVVAGFAILATDTSPAEAQSTASARALYDQLAGSQSTACANNVVDGGVYPAACTLSLDKPLVLYTCSDPDGCTVTLSEVGATTGRRMQVINVSSNVSTFADTSGVSELAGAFAAGQWDTLSVIYATDRWVELGRSNN